MEESSLKICFGGQAPGEADTERAKRVEVEAARLRLLGVRLPYGETDTRNRRAHVSQPSSKFSLTYITFSDNIITTSDNGG